MEMSVLPGRAEVLRAPPVVLEDHLSRAYAARFKLEGASSEDFDATVQRLAEAGFSLASLQAARAALLLVEGRCTVSRVHREVLDQAIEQMPA